MKILFYANARGKSPAYEAIRKLQAEDRLRIFACLKSIEELGLDCPRVQFRQVKGKLWEIKIKTRRSGYRIFYVTVKQSMMILLHIYQKQSQKAPKKEKEIEIAKKRMLEVQQNETLYNIRRSY
jgi:phage-related protein